MSNCNSCGALCLNDKFKLSSGSILDALEMRLKICRYSNKPQQCANKEMLTQVKQFRTIRDTSNYLITNSDINDMVKDIKAKYKVSSPDRYVRLHWITKDAMNSFKESNIFIVDAYIKELDIFIEAYIYFVDSTEEAYIDFKDVSNITNLIEVDYKFDVYKNKELIGSAIIN